MFSRSTPGSDDAAVLTEAEDTLDDPAAATSRCLAELTSRERVELEAELTVEGRGRPLEEEGEEEEASTLSTDSHSRTPRQERRVPAEVTRAPCCPLAPVADNDDVDAATAAAAAASKLAPPLPPPTPPPPLPPRLCLGIGGGLQLTAARGGCSDTL